jgi:glycosyltransferase involved in cell wall biosynthesis
MSSTNGGRGRIMHVVADGALGGGSLHVLQIIRGLSSRFAFAVATQPDSFLAEQAKLLGSAVFPIDLFGPPLRSMRLLAPLVRRPRADAVHAHGTRSAFYLGRARGEFPAVYTVHGYHFLHSDALRRWLGCQAERYITKRVAHTVFVSKQDARRAALHGFNFGASSVIHNGIECSSAAKPSERQSRHVGFVGRLESPKDPLLFLRVLADLPGYTATMIGDGSMRRQVEAEVTRMGLADRVRLCGMLDNDSARHAMSEFDCILVTSRWEGFPLVVLEAHCLGVPVVAAAVDGVTEVIEDGVNGLLIDSRVPHALAGAVRRVTTDSELRGSLVANGRERVRSEFSEERMLAAIEHIYSHVTAGAA